MLTALLSSILVHFPGNYGKPTQSCQNAIRKETCLNLENHPRALKELTDGQTLNEILENGKSLQNRRRTNVVLSLNRNGGGKLDDSGNFKSVSLMSVLGNIL